MNALWLEGVDLVQMTKKEDSIECLCTSNGVSESCPECGVVGHVYKHGVKTKSYRDVMGLPFRKPVNIWVDVQRYKCRSCNATFNQPVPDMDDSRRMTKRCVDWVVTQGIIDSFSSVARGIFVDEKTVRDICKPEFKKLLAKREIESAPLTAPALLGLDELKLDKKMRAIFVDIGRHRVIDLISSNDSEDIENWVKTKLEIPEAVRVVSIDMCSTYRKLARRLFPNAIIVADRFHVQRGATKALDRVRNRARKAAEDPKDRKNPWRGQRLLRLHGYKLNEEATEEVTAIRDKFPLVDDAYRTKEAFYTIWDAESRTEAEERFKEWKASIPSGIKKEFGGLARQITLWHPEVFNYFDCGITNAITENYNGLIKMVNRMGRGYDFDVLRAKVLLAPPITGRICKCCKKNAAVSTFAPVTMGGWEPEDEEFEQDLCGSCRFLWEKFYMPMKKSLIEGWAQDG